MGYEQVGEMLENSNRNFNPDDRPIIIGSKILPKNPFEILLVPTLSATLWQVYAAGNHCREDAAGGGCG